MKKSENRRESIISASIDLFYQHGYQKASLRDIAQRVGVTQAAIYYHFSCKEEILLTIIEQFTNQLFFTLKSCLADNKDPVNNLKNAIIKHCILTKSIRSGAKIIIEDKRFLSNDLRKMAKEKEKVIYYLYRDYLAEMQKSNLIKECDLTMATFGILGMINWLYHWYNPEGKIKLETMAEEMVQNLFYGLLK